MPELTSLNRSDLDTCASSEESATRSVRCPGGNSALTAWPNLLWCMALIGLLLLPSHYRAGGASAHGHALVQLWIDAGDGSIRHAHHHPASGSGPAVVTSWLDPLVEDVGNVGSASIADETLDIADQQETAPLASGFHILIMSVPVALAVGGLLPPEAGSDGPIAGLSPRVLLPPPRWTPNAI